MVSERDADNTCFSPRDYQVELLDKACKKNTIVQLGTGAGKTFIAVLLLKEYGLQLHSKFSNGGQRAFFIVDKVSLVEQQAEHIAIHTTYNVGQIHGTLNHEYTNSKAEFDNYIEKHHVVVITAQVLLDLTLHAVFDLSRAGVLVFDECHHALGKKHPYHVLMDRYRDLPKESRPRILGLTASLINDKIPPEQLEAHLSHLESVLDCGIETASDLVSLSKYGAKPNEFVVSCKNFIYRTSLTVPMMKILESVNAFCNSTNEFDEFDVNPMKCIKEPLARSKAVIQQLGPWGVWKVAQIWEKRLKAWSQHKYFPDKSVDFILMAGTCMNTLRRLVEPTIRSIQSIDGLHSIMPHKVQRLLKVLEMFSPEQQEKQGVSDPLCGIIFVQQRYVAYILNLLLRHICKLDPAYKFLKPDFVVGFSTGKVSAEESQSQHRRQEEALRRFRKGELNLLVATNVLEEGVDVRHCNLVIKFDRPSDYRSYVQSKGRARKAGAKYIILAEEQELNSCSEDLRAFAKIQKLLLNRSQSVHNPSDYEPPSFAEDVDRKFEPYVVKSTGAKVTMSSAISLVNRYCGKLPSDIFTRLVPQNKLIPVVLGGVTKYRAELLLPINSPIKQVIRTKMPMDSKRLAAMAVALEACKVLHERGELNDHLLPVGRESIAILSHLDEDPDELVPGMAAKVGSSKRKQLYDKHASTLLGDAQPVARKPCYIYVMQLELMKEQDEGLNRKNRKFAKPEDYNCTFGFLSSVKLPSVPSFPAYLRQGDMRVHLTRAKKEIVLDSPMLARIKMFHHYVFNEVLQLCKANMTFHIGEESPMNVLIVPLEKEKLTDGSENYTINMKYVMDVVDNMENMPRVPDEETRKNYKFRAEDYNDAVVMPWYRNVDQPVFYYVAQILDEYHPSSKFPDEDYETFNEYFIKKYNLEIYDQEQCLLDVDFTTNRLNLLLPRAKKQRPAKESTSTHSPQHQILVPELMDRHPISATLWSLIAALPSFFYRINHLLVSDELRQRICIEALEMTEVNAVAPEDYAWAPLSYPATYEEKQSLIVTKVQQLRAQNQLLEANQRKEAAAMETDEFEIGVWDPDLAAHFVPSLVNPVPANVDGAIPNGATFDDSVGLMGSSNVRSGDLSDDEDADAVVMFDFKQYIAEKTGGSLSSDFAAPREDIVESGWGDLDDLSPDADAPFQLLSGTGINTSALFADLQRDIMSSTSSSIPLQPASSSGANKNKGSDSSAAKPTAGGPTSVASKSQPINNTAVMKRLFQEKIDLMEDMEKTSHEETIDLADYDEDVTTAIEVSDDDSDTELEKTKVIEENEMILLEEGEQEKLRRDELSADDRVLTEAAVLAPELSDARFSFAAPSTSLTSIDRSALAQANVDLSEGNPLGVSPCLLLTALTTSSANDGINLERLETIGDSFLKYAVTDCLYHQFVDQHEGKLSFARSKEVSNCNLYRLGKRLQLPSLMVAGKFDVQNNWLPPCYSLYNNFKAPNSDDAAEHDRYMEDVLDGREDVQERVKIPTGWDQADADSNVRESRDGVEIINFPVKQGPAAVVGEEIPPLPYNLHTQQYISDKSIADAVEALIGAHLLTLGPQPTLKVMSWIGLKVITDEVESFDPLLRFIDTPEDPNASTRMLTNMFAQFQFAQLEEKIGYRFKNKAYLLQSFTHASYFKNRITGCYQRLEFLGDAVLDYMITRYLFEDTRQYSPGVLTDLRSALVNNTIFASLAVKYDFHKHFVAMCPRLHHMIEKFVKLCKERGFFDANFNAEMYMITTEEEIDEGQEEDIEVPKAMSDIFESVAGAVYLDSGRDLDTVWRVFFNLMKTTIEQCCSNPPRSPIRELMELEPNKTRFSKMERIIETGKVRVTVDIGNKMKFTGMGRNYRIAKTTAAKRALRYLKSLEEQKLRDAEKKAREDAAKASV